MYDYPHSVFFVVFAYIPSKTLCLYAVYGHHFVVLLIMSYVSVAHGYCSCK